MRSFRQEKTFACRNHEASDCVVSGGRMPVYSGFFAMGAARAEKCADAVWQNPVLYLEKPISAEDAQNIAESAVFTAWGGNC